MARVTKAREERREELLDIAERLFSEEGYENTAVSKIVKSAEVAQGTFYYYFQSKEDILEAILERRMEMFRESLNTIINNRDIGATRKLEIILKSLFKSSTSDDKVSNSIEDNKYDKSHQKLEEKFYQTFKPIFLTIVHQGMQEKDFDIEHEEEITEILLIGIRGYIHIHRLSFSDREYFIKKIRAIEELFKRALGIQKDFNLI